MLENKRVVGKASAVYWPTERPGVYLRTWTASEEVDVAVLGAELAKIEDQLVFVSGPVPGDKELLEMAREGVVHPYYSVQRDRAWLEARKAEIGSVLDKIEAIE